MNKLTWTFSPLTTYALSVHSRSVLKTIEKAKLCTHVIPDDINVDSESTESSPPHSFPDPFQELGEKLKETFDFKNKIL